MERQSLGRSPRYMKLYVALSGLGVMFGFLWALIGTYVGARGKSSPWYYVVNEKHVGYILIAILIAIAIVHRGRIWRVVYYFVAPFVSLYALDHLPLGYPIFSGAPEEIAFFRLFSKIEDALFVLVRIFSCGHGAALPWPTTYSLT